MRRSWLVPVVCAALTGLAANRCASSPPAGPRDHFPLDPREGLTGPFDEAVERGWRSLLAGDAALAGNEFAQGSAGASRRAGEIGAIEALVASGHSSDALRPCLDALAVDAKPTVPLLVACGEAQARAGSPVNAFELYANAAAQAPSLSGLAARAAGLLPGATDAVLLEAERDAAQGRRAAARAGAAQAIEWNPRSGPVLARAAGIECDVGEKDLALQYYREALALGGLDVEARERAGALALEVGDDVLAVSVFDALAAEDPRFADEAAAARLAFRIANWPEAERQAARARRLTRSGAAALVWWTFSEVREAHVTGSIVASDLLERRDSRAMMRAVSLGLLDVDGELHRARPDAYLTRAAAAQLMLRLAGIVRGSGAGPACLRGSPGPWRGAVDAIRLAARCGLLSESGGPSVSGPEFTRGLDRLRTLLPAGEDQVP